MSRDESLDGLQGYRCSVQHDDAWAEIAGREKWSFTIYLPGGNEITWAGYDSPGDAHQEMREQLAAYRRYEGRRRA